MLRFFLILVFLSLVNSGKAQNESSGDSIIHSKRNIWPIGVLSHKNVRVSGIYLTAGQNYKAENVTINGISISLIGNGFYNLWAPKPRSQYWIRDSFEVIINGIHFGSVLGDIINGQVNGIMAGYFFNEANEVNGASVSMFNYLIDCNGISIAFLNNVDNLNGLQIGLVNRSKNFNGIQIGLINKSFQAKGIQIGLLNRIGKRTLPIINLRL